MKFGSIHRVFASILLAATFSVALAAPGEVEVGPIVCGSLDNGYGPFDYRTDKRKLKVVEAHHFDASVEQLRRGKSSRLASSDLDYTLRAFPNHHRALMSVMNLGLRSSSVRPAGLGFRVECYMERAERFRPDDAMVKVIYGTYLIRLGRNGQAIEKLEAAAKLDEQDANIHYNLGLAYLDVDEFDKALASAHRAYALGFPLPGLRDRLQRAGKWRDPVVAEARTATGGAVAPVDAAQKPTEAEAPAAHN